MILLIDVGNSRLKWAIWQESTFTFGSAIAYKQQTLTIVMTMLWQSLPAPTHMLVANVAGDAVTTALQQFADAQWHIAPTFIQSSKEALGVYNAYQQPEQLGVDRWLAMLAAWSLFHNSVAIFDCGSALTVDVVNAHGQHQGGLIVPGLTLLTQAYQKGTYNGEQTHFVNTLHISQKTSTRLLGTNTQDCITFGTHNLLTAFIKQVSQDLKKQYGTNLKLLLTGGDAEILQSHLPTEFIYRPHLVLEGLRDLYTICSADTRGDIRATDKILQFIIPKTHS